MAKPALGRGLGALLGSGQQSSHRPENAPQAPSASEAGEDHIVQADVKRIHTSPFQPRKHFDDEALQDLATSIREQGVLQPLITRQSENGFELIAGERRWRAAQMAGLREVPVIVRKVNDAEMLQMMLIENLQREDLDPIEEAEGYARLIQEFQLKQDDVAQRVGRSRAAVANALRLLKLPNTLRRSISTGELSVGQAKVILGLPSADLQSKAAKQIIRDGLSVREAERLVTQWLHPESPEDSASGPSSSTAESGQASPPRQADPHILDLEQRIQEKLGTKARLTYKDGQGRLDIRFYSQSDLQRFLDIAGIQID